jgi:hypothetical protein
MCVTLGGASLSMTENLADEIEAFAARNRDRGVGLSDFDAGADMVPTWPSLAFEGFRLNN